MTATVAPTKQSDWSYVSEQMVFVHGGSMSGTITLRRNDGWTATARFADDALIGVELTAPPGEVLTARLLRSFPLGDLERTARTVAANLLGGFAQLANDAGRWLLFVRAMLLDGRPNDLGLAALAALYVTRCAESDHAAIDLALDLGITKQRFWELGRDAVGEGLLIDVPTGKQGGRLTEKARHLLRIAGEEQ